MKNIIISRKDTHCIIKIKRLHIDAKIPKYKYTIDSGADIFSAENYTLKPFEIKAIRTGICAEIPAGFELQIRPKSGLARYSGITVLNTPGTIDSGYIGEIKVILINLSSKPYKIKKGQKIAQIVTAPVTHAYFKEVKKLSKSKRGTSGFGSSGLL